MLRRRSALASVERDAYLASGAAGDLHAASAKPATRRMDAVGVLTVFLGLAELVVGTIACEVTGAWVGMIFVVIFGLGPMLWAGWGGRDETAVTSPERKTTQIRVVPLLLFFAIVFAVGAAIGSAIVSSH